MAKAGATVTADAVKASVIDGQELARTDLENGTKNDSMLADNTIVTYTGFGRLALREHAQGGRRAARLR